MTLEECIALPVWEGYGLEERVINGVPMHVPTEPKMQCFFVDDTTPIQWREADGICYRLAQYADGRWCKRRI